ncbi:MAG: hypothetical protein AVDCRST_MAG45-1116 [uncultured Solirubrobacterales bacterium]|uniref:Uncharacterized protein n=1 Tax=uncultured Solirubrobacterales bacterium TaxID=768556 RepID=A0A6J4SMS8_9ACTN|nr:MAG: hypothetical protein AVDCRST_MAG45-1116 [uncultured Solirubrobacterales bacterium]
MALISNPMTELTGPLNRVETALNQLCTDLATLDVLPGVEQGVSQTNERLARVEQELSLTRTANEQTVTSLEAIRADLGEVVRLLAAGLLSGAQESSGAVAAAPSVALRPRD